MKGHLAKKGERWYAVLDATDKAGKRHRKWTALPDCKGKREAQKACAALITQIGAADYTEPSKLTVGGWITKWLEVGAPGKRKKKVSQRSLERYSQLLRTHVLPALGSRPLKKLMATDIDAFYAAMAQAKVIKPRTQHNVHVVFASMLATALRKGLISVNPMAKAEQVPASNAFDGEDIQDNIGEGLTDVELATLIAGFRAHVLFPFVVLAAASGARRNELLALRWTDLDLQKRTIRIERALEQTQKYAVRVKPPKTQRGYRTIELDDATIALLLEEKKRHQRFVAGVGADTSVDLSLIRLPDDALMFPVSPLALSTPWHPRDVSRGFATKAGKLGFGTTRLHDLRGIHSTALLDAGIPVHTVAQRIGDDPATLLRSYTKRKRSAQADTNLSSAITNLAAGFLNRIG